VSALAVRLAFLYDAGRDFEAGDACLSSFLVGSQLVVNTADELGKGCMLLAEAGINIRYNRQVIRRPSVREPFRIQDRLDTRVSILKIHPGITPQVVRDILCGVQTRAVILETYGSGNAPSREWFLDLVREAAGMGKVLLNVTQCQAGTVDMSLYATGRSLQEAGVASGHDCTTEGALAKLFYLMGKTEDNAEVTALLDLNIRGEITK